MKNLKENWKIQLPTLIGLLLTLTVTIFNDDIREWFINHIMKILIYLAILMFTFGIIAWWIKFALKDEWMKVEKRFSDIENTFTDVAIINSLNTLLLRDIVLQHIGYDDDLIKALLDKNFTIRDLDMLGNEIDAKFKRKFYIKSKEREIEKMKDL